MGCAARHRAGLRATQDRTRRPTVHAPRAGRLRGRVEAAVRHPQPAQAVAAHPPPRRNSAVRRVSGAKTALACRVEGPPRLPSRARDSKADRSTAGMADCGSSASPFSNRLVRVKSCAPTQSGERRPVGCVNAFMQLAGTRGASRRADRVGAPCLAGPWQRRSARWVDPALLGSTPGAGGAGCSAGHRSVAPAPGARAPAISSQSRHSARTVRIQRSA
jgi:hypothetical protein